MQVVDWMRPPAPICGFIHTSFGFFLIVVDVADHSSGRVDSPKLP